MMTRRPHPIVTVAALPQPCGLQIQFYQMLKKPQQKYPNPVNPRRCPHDTIHVAAPPELWSLQIQYCQTEQKPQEKIPGPSEPADPVLPDRAETPGEVPGPSEPAVPVLPAGAEPLGEALSDEPLEPVAEAEDSTVRRSTRQTAGQHPNPNREPRSAVNNS
ncbi:hypothetical protein OS493_037877, partial [Desmophyllum pertusum]